LVSILEEYLLVLFVSPQKYVIPLFPCVNQKL
jgi:hypothetical protein